MTTKAANRVQAQSTQTGSKGLFAATVVLVGVFAVVAYLAFYGASLVQEGQGVATVQLAGLAVVGLVLLHTGVGLATSVRRLAKQDRVDRLTTEYWQHRLETALARREQREQSAASWAGYRKFEIRRKVPEGGDVCSFYLEPHDHKPLPAFLPGQYLTFRLNIPGRDKPTIRCYSLSDSPNPDAFRVSIKRVPPPRDKPDVPPGLVSGFFHDELKEGDIVDVMAPSGSFFLDTTEETPIVLLAGGIGLTPMLSMLNTVVANGSKREVWFFFAVRNSNDHIMKDHLRRLAAENDNVNLHVCYDNALDSDVEGRDYDHAERVSVDLLKRLLPSNNYEFYICGPPPMMKSMVEGLMHWGVPEQRIFYEAFGPASIKKKPAPADAEAAGAQADNATVTFQKSGKTVQWDAECANLLDLAEQNGLSLDFGCRAGNCGTCLVAIIDGDVTYTSDPDQMPEAGSCLACVAAPKGNLTLDA